jgi:hypothetical protein
MGCGCGGAKKQVYKVIAADGSSKTFDTYSQAQTEIRQNGGRIRVTNAS